MPKTPNWTKNKEGSAHYAEYEDWENDEVEALLSVTSKQSDATGVVDYEILVHYGDKDYEIIATNISDYETAKETALNWMEDHPYADKDASDLMPLTDEQRSNLIDTIMGVRAEENSNRSSGDKLTDEEMRSFRERLEEMDDENQLVDIWFQWVGEWLNSRPRMDSLVQFEKTLAGTHDYGFA